MHGNVTQKHAHWIIMSHHNKNHLPYVMPYYVIICKYKAISITYRSLNAIVAQLKTVHLELILQLSSNI
jgi:hypothetical protein